jgi:hypothetical protein
MSENRIQTDVVYNHEKWGEVLVTGISKMYDEWDVSNANGLSGEPDSASENEVLVFFHTRFDGYGGMEPTPTSQNIIEFARCVDEVRAFEYPEVSDLREE